MLNSLLRIGGCSPWRLGCETALHCFPAVGVVTSGVAWCLRACEIRALNGLTRNQSGSDEIGENPFLTMRLSLSEHSLVGEKRLIAARKANCAALFWINVVVTTVITVSLVKRYGG